MTVAQFGALRSDERMLFAVGKLAPGIAQFAADYVSTSGKLEDKLPAGSMANTAQEIETQLTYNLRYAFSMDQGDEREKYILAVLHDGKDSGWYPIIEAISKDAPNMVFPTIFGRLDTITVDTGVTAGEISTSPDGLKYRTITSIFKGKEVSVIAYYLEVPLPDGSTYKTWIRK